jgi:topoisomerase-4 subunit A
MSDAKTVSIVDEPTTLIVSKHGWLRSRQGHNIDPAQLAFRSGDSLLACLPCRTVDHLILLDTNGRAYSIAASDIPGGKGDGVPATSLADFQDRRQALPGAGVSRATKTLPGRRQRRLRLPLPGRGFAVARQGRQGLHDAGEGEAPVVFACPRPPARSPA